MQTKSYRALKWTLFMGMAATLASACVVSTGDGDDNDVTIEGGDGGTNNTSGTTNTGGSKAGSSGSGGTSAGTTTTAGTAGSTTVGGTGGTAADPDYPGVCDDSLEMPGMIDETAACAEKDQDNACGACLKMNCCETLAACYGKEPTSACGYGPSPADEFGQFDCILFCYDANDSKIADGLKTHAEVIADCAGECSNQCADVGDGLVNLDTQALLDCAQNGDEENGTEDCNDACFPAPMD
jgi:hypothetical protein